MERKNLEGKRIKIYARSYSLELYCYSKGLYETFGVPVVRATDQTADGYFYTMLKDTDCDIAINIDEDAFVINPDAILDLAEYMLENNYVNVGISEFCRGSRFNSVITNPFFNIFHLAKIREKYISSKEVKKFNYEAVRDELKAKLPQEMLNANFDCVDFEPYYQFFFWLAYNFDTLYLPYKTHKDGISTILYDNKGNELLFHSWYARFYNVSTLISRFWNVKNNQTIRIDALIDEAYRLREMGKPAKLNQITLLCDKTIRFVIKSISRVCGFPRKWLKWYKRYQRKKKK